jgi:hypothetical protein
MIAASTSYNESTKDIIAWYNFKLFEDIEIDKKSPMNYFVFGSKTFTYTTQMLSPLPGKFCFFIVFVNCRYCMQTLCLYIKVSS